MRIAAASRLAVAFQRLFGGVGTSVAYFGPIPHLRRPRFCHFYIPGVYPPFPPGWLATCRASDRAGQQDPAYDFLASSPATLTSRRCSFSLVTPTLLTSIS